MDKHARALGKKGGRARAEKLSKKRRQEIARNAALKRWKKSYQQMSITAA